MDKQLTCKDCNSSFLFSKSEQDFYASKNFSEPVRCPSCRRANKQRKLERERGFQGGGRSDDRRNRY